MKKQLSHYNLHCYEYAPPPPSPHTLPPPPPPKKEKNQNKKTLPILHCVPLYPGAQTQMNAFISSSHVPPFSHGSDSHSSSFWKTHLIFKTSRCLESESQSVSKDYNLGVEILKKNICIKFTHYIVTNVFLHIIIF